MDALERHPPTSPNGPIRDGGPGDLIPGDSGDLEDDLETWVRPETTEWLVSDVLDAAPVQSPESAQPAPPPSPWLTEEPPVDREPPPAPLVPPPAPLVPPPAAPVPQFVAPPPIPEPAGPDVADLEARLVIAERELQAMEGARDRERARAEELERQVVDLRAQSAEMETRAAELETRAAELETRAAESETRAAELETRAAEMETRAAESETRAAQANRRLEALRGGLRDAAGRLELNSATVEALHSLGLSMTQACRIVVARDARAGFEHPSEIAEIPGIPPDLRDAVAARLYVERAPG